MNVNECIVHMNEYMNKIIRQLDRWMDDKMNSYKMS